MLPSIRHPLRARRARRRRSPSCSLSRMPSVGSAHLTADDGVAFVCVHVFFKSFTLKQYTVVVVALRIRPSRAHCQHQHNTARRRPATRRSPPIDRHNRRCCRPTASVRVVCLWQYPRKRTNDEVFQSASTTPLLTCNPALVLCNGSDLTSTGGGRAMSDCASASRAVLYAVSHAAR